MKGFLILIFSTIQFFCFGQQTTKTHFNDLNEALKQPQNVTSLYINQYTRQEFDINSLKVFTHLTNLQLIHFDSEVDFAHLFDVLKELSQLDTLQLSHCSLTVVPDQVGRLQSLTCFKINDCRGLKDISAIKQLVNLTYLDLSGNSISVLPNIFDSLKKIKILKLNSNQLTELPEFICLLTELEELQFYSNNLTFLPECIIELKQLKQLSLSANPITYLPESFNQLLLEEIYLGENKFKVFPYQIFDISTLKKISVHNTDVDSLPRSVAKLVNLEYIYFNLNHKFNWQDAFVKLSKNEKLTQLIVRGYGLENLPEEISLLKNLTYLKVQGFGNTSNAVNYFATMTTLTELEVPFYANEFLPPSIGALTNLKILRLEGCHITSLPSTIGQLTSLEELYITKYFDNKILDVPNEIGNLINLKTLDLSACNLKSLPRTISNCTKLKQLDLAKNDFSGIPNEISNLSSLETLSFYGNKITAISNVIGQLDRLIELTLSDNKIEKVPAAIWKLKALETLLLNDNNIVEFEIPDSVSTSLTGVYLSENISLKMLPDFFAQLTNLEYLDLECTQVTQLPDGLKLNSNLKKIQLSENLITNKKILNKEFGGKIDFRYECEQLIQPAVNYHDLYGKIKTDIKTKNDSITLYYYYSYGGRVTDDGYTENIFFTLPKIKAVPGVKFMLPDSLVSIVISHTSWWDALLPESKLKYENLQGEISFVSVKNNKIKTYINLYCDGYDDTKRILIDEKNILFKKER